MPAARPFLTANWRYLLMINYVVDPAALQPVLPAGTQPDLWEGQALVSVIGQLFQDTRLFGVAVPFHRHFEAVRLVCFACREEPSGSQRGVVVIKDLVPRPWIAQMAGLVYGEDCLPLRMGHTIEVGQLGREALVEYAWRYRGRLNRLGGLAVGEARPAEPGTLADFLTSPARGFIRQGAKQASVYGLDHQPWRTWQVEQPYLLCNVKALYGEALERFLHQRPHSALLAEGSPVCLEFPRRVGSR